MITPTPSPTSSFTIQPVVPVQQTLETPITIEMVLTGASVVVICWCLGTLAIHLWRAMQKRRNHRRRSTD